LDKKRLKNESVEEVKINRNKKWGEDGGESSQSEVVELNVRRRRLYRV